MAIMNIMITSLLQKNSDKYYTYYYIRLLLQVTPDKSQWLEFDSQGGEAGVSSFILSGSPILEQLLIASSRHPQVLKRIQTALKGLQDAGAIIPDEFKMLWAHFEKEIRK